MPVAPQERKDKMVTYKKDDAGVTVFLSDFLFEDEVTFSDNLDENKTVYETLGGGADMIKLGAVDEKGRALEGGIREVNAHAYCGWFNFSGADQNKKPFPYTVHRSPETDWITGSGLSAGEAAA